MKKLTMNCFKAYDIRGRIGDELNEEVVYRIGRAFGTHLKPKSVVVGGDVRLTSQPFKEALSNGLLDAGVDVIDLGMTGTEEIYFATSHLETDGGIEVTASHNPMDYNGMKLVGKNARPIGNSNGLLEIKALAESAEFPEVETRGTLTKRSLLTEYVDHLMSYIEPEAIKPLKIVVNAGNGAAGHVVDELEARFDHAKVPVEFIKVNHAPDGHFPNGIPNPLLPEKRKDTADAVIEHGADVGIAWDGDFDRCFFFDEKGKFIEGYYIVGLLAEAFLSKELGAKIVHDTRLFWNTNDVTEKSNGQAVPCKAGHAFIKDEMRAQDAIYGGEMSAHHYFRDFSYCDSGMIPWLLVIELLSKSNASMSSFVTARELAFPSSGEINRKVSDAQKVFDKVLEVYAEEADSIDELDGIGLDMGSWRFNLRKSNTEPLIRLNVESRDDTDLMNEKTKELLDIIDNV